MSLIRQNDFSFRVDGKTHKLDLKSDIVEALIDKERSLTDRGVVEPFNDELENSFAQALDGLQI